MKNLMGSIELNRSGCVEDVISVLLANGYTVSLKYIENNKINVKIEKEIKE